VSRGTVQQRSRRIATSESLEAVVAAVRAYAAPRATGSLADDRNHHLKLEVSRIANEMQQVSIAKSLPVDTAFGSALTEAKFPLEFSPDRVGRIGLECPTLQCIRAGHAATRCSEACLSAALHPPSGKPCVIS
jgi:hypothetical protein